MTPDTLESLITIGTYETAPGVTETTDPETGDITIDVIAPVGYGAKRAELGFYDNLAEVLPDDKLNTFANDLMTGIQQDDQNRGPWLQFFQSATRLLGCSVEDAAATAQGATGAGRVSNLKSSSLLMACVNFQSNAATELFPANGPVKAKTNLLLDKKFADLPGVLAASMNEYFTMRDVGYQADFDRSMFHLGFGGMVFRKVYRCPLRRRPTSEMISGLRMIISDATKSLRDCERYTHEIPMSQNTMRQMQSEKYYRECVLGQPTYDASTVEASVNKQSGQAPINLQPQDVPHTVYESYVMAYLHEEPNNPDKLRRPYIVTIEKDSQKILRITRNWEQKDPLFTPLEHIVEYSMFPGLGYWAYGFAIMMQSGSRAATALVNIMLDSGIFANFPGGLRNKSVKIDQSDLRPMPGQFPAIDIGDLDDIRKAIMPLPYKSPDPFLLQLLQHIEGWMSQLAGIADMPEGASLSNTPVGTILAAVDQAIKPITAVHKRCFKSMQQEFAIFVRLFKEDPAPLVPQYASPETKTQIIQALELAEVSPVADPNVPSMAYRVMLLQALMQLKADDPSQYNARKIHERALQALGIPDYLDLMTDPNAQPSPDPKAMAEMAKIELQKAALTLKQVAEKSKFITEQQNQEIKREELRAALAEQIRQAEDSKLDRASRERIAASRERMERINLLIEIAQAFNMFGLESVPQLDPRLPATLEEGVL
jgi:hypothetical protein